MGMHKVWEIIPKKVRQINGEALSPAMRVVVTTKMHTNNPFNSGSINEIIETHKCPLKMDMVKN